MNVPSEVEKLWTRKRLKPWFRANMTAWLYEYTRKYAGAQQSVQLVPAVNRFRNIQASLCDPAKISDPRSEKNLGINWLLWLREHEILKDQPESNVM